MGRPEKPLNAAGPIAVFARDLRRLRVSAGNPNYREMAQAAWFSPSVLSSAANGHRLPTLQVTLAFVHACGGDRAEWERRWRRLAEQVKPVRVSGGRKPPATSATAVRTLPVRPAQLPMGPRDFVGHGGELAAARMSAAPSNGAKIPLVISGQVGVGKTAFALRLAHELSGDLPDGQLYADLGSGESAETSPFEVMSGFLRALGVPSHQIPADPMHRTGLYRSLLAQRQVLVLLDDARDEAQVRPLLAPSSHSQILVTSRGRLLGVDGARRTELDVLSRDESVAMLTAIVGEDRMRIDASAEHGAGVQLVELCDDLPLALNIVGRKVCARPDWTIADVVDQLAERTRRLDRLRVGDISMAGRLTSAYLRLDPLARQAFHHVSGVRAARLTATGLAVSMEMAVDSAEHLLERLLDAGLLHRTTADGRYGVLTLFRLFAAHQPDPWWDGPEPSDIPLVGCPCARTQVSGLEVTLHRAD